MAEAELEIRCPLDGGTESVEIEDLEDGSVELECSVCGSGLEVSYTVETKVTVDGVEVVDPPVAEGECPQCGNQVEVEDVEEESGEAERDCGGCESPLVVRWSDWGRTVEIEAVGDAVDSDDEDEEDEEDEDEEGAEDGDETEEGYGGEEELELGDELDADVEDDEIEEDDEW